MPSKKTATSKTIEAPEKHEEFVKIAIPLVDPIPGNREENRLYISKASYEKSIEEYLARNDAYAYIYVSEQEYLSIFEPNPDDNPIRNEFMQYAIDSRRRIAEVCGATTNSIILKVPNGDPAMLDFIQKSKAVLRFYYNSKSTTNRLELKKGTWIHIIEVAVIGPVQAQQPDAESVPPQSDIPFAETAETVPADVVDRNGDPVTE